MAKRKFVHFIPRPKPKKRPGVHKKSQNKSEKRQKKQTRYKGQGRWQVSQNILVSRYERKNYNYKNKSNISTTILNIVVGIKYNEKTMEVLWS